MLLSKEKSVFADIPNPLTRLKDKDLHRPPAAGSLHASDTFFFVSASQEPSLAGASISEKEYIN